MRWYSGCTAATPTLVTARSRIHQRPQLQPCMTSPQALQQPKQQLLLTQQMRIPHINLPGNNEQKHQRSSKLHFLRGTTRSTITNLFETKKKKCESLTLVASIIVVGGGFVVLSIIYMVVIIQLPTPMPSLTSISTIPHLNSNHHLSSKLRMKNEPELRRDVTHTTIDPYVSSSIYDYAVPVSFSSSTDRIPDPIVVLYPNQQFIVIVMSHRNHHQRRTMIRQTWGRAYSKSLLFVIAGANRISSRKNYLNESFLVQQHEQQLQLIEEQALYHDLLDTIHPESYRSLPHKLRFAIHWVTTKIQQQQPSPSILQWILKVDDDMYVRDIHHFIASPPPVSRRSDSLVMPVVMGCIQYYVPVQRYGKWAEETWFYERYPIYPPWPKGSCGYIFNHAVAKIIAKNYNEDMQMMLNRHQEQQALKQTTSNIKLYDGSSDSPQNRNFYRQSLLLPSYQGEDTSFGIWLQHSNVTWIDSPFFVNHGNCDVKPPHGFYPTKQPQQVLRGPTATGLHIEDNDTMIPWSIGHRMTSEQIQRCYDIEHISIHNGSIPYSPLDYTPTFHDSRAQTNDFQTMDDNNMAYSNAMMHHEADEKRLKRQHEIEERFERRNKIKQLRNRQYSE